MAVLNKRAVVSAIEMYGVSSIRLPKVLGESFDALIKSLFANNEQGFAYDPNDLSTMFQDAAGTVPVTGVGQPVGLVLDKSKGLVRGVEKWIDGSVVFAGASSRINPNTYRIYTPDGTFSAAQILGTLTVGRMYEISFEIISIANAGGGIVFEGSPVLGFNTVGKKRQIITATAANLTLKRAAALLTDYTVTNISVREIFGNHAYQTNAASRPILRQNATTGAYYLEFDGVDDRLVTGSFPSMGLATTIFAGSRGSKAATAAVVARGIGGYIYQTSRQVSVQSVNNTVTLLQSGNTVITAKYAASGAGVTLKVNNVSNTNPATTERGFYAATPLVIGAFSANGEVPYLGHIYSLIGVSRIATDEESMIVEREIAKRMGVTLSV